MKKVRLIINGVLGSMVAALGLTSCEEHMVKYGIPDDPGYADTTVHCMYGVNPNPDINWEEEQNSND